MLIGIDASRYPHTSPTGVEVYSHEIIRGLISLCAKQKKSPEQKSPNSNEKSSDQSPRSSSPDVAQIVLYTPQPIEDLPKSIQCLLPGQRFWTHLHLAREIKKNPPDVLFVPSHVLPFRLPFPSKTKTVIMIHDVAFRTFPQAYPLFQRLYLHFTTRFAVKRASRLLVPSEATAQDLIRFYKCDPEKITIIPHGYSRPRLKVSPQKITAILKRFQLKRSDSYIFFIGRLETKKNLARLIEAFYGFKKTHSEWRLILGGGRGAGFSEILKTAQKNNSNGILMPGYLDEEEKLALFSHANIFAFPSLAEGFGFPILEAAGYGAPILASEIPAFLPLSDLIDAFSDPLDVKSIEKGLCELADHPPPHTPKDLKAYSWKKAAEKTWEVLS
ncbi:MAG: glycosyltransferase family 1 protein [Candidatus Gracilibacteria bacterium]